MSERTSANEYIIWLASYLKRSRSKEVTEPIFTELFRTVNKRIAYEVFIAICTLASSKQDSKYLSHIRLERHGVVVKELKV